MFLEKITKIFHKPNILANTQNFRPPMGGERVSVICKNQKCGYIGYGTLTGPQFSISNKLSNTKCPQCKKRTLIMNPWVEY